MTAAVRDYYEPLGVPRDSCSAGELASATVVGLGGTKWEESGLCWPALT